MNRIRQQLVSHYQFIVSLLLLAIAFQCVLSMRVNSVTYDEPNHLVAGYTYLKTGDFGLNWPNPPLINVISATPLLFMNIQMQDPDQNGRSYVHDFLYVHSDNADQIIFWARVPSVLLSLLLGFFVFRWARELYGVESGLFSLFLYAFCPNILAHSMLATTDLGTACFTFLACYCLWKFGSRPLARNLFLAGLTLGLALISKFSTVFLLPVYLLFAFIQVFFNSPQPKLNSSLELDPQAHTSANPLKKCGRWMVYSGLVIGIAALVIVAAYPCCFKPWYRFDETILPAIQRWYPKVELNKGLWKFVSSTRVPGREYALGLLGLVEHSKKGHDAFLWGQISSQGWWYYYLAALAIKTPIALQIMFLLAFGFSLLRYITKETAPNLYDDFFLVIPPLLLFAALSFGTVKIGLRHVLFVFPFIFVFTARFFKLASERPLLSVWRSL